MSVLATGCGELGSMPHPACPTPRRHFAPSALGDQLRPRQTPTSGTCRRCASARKVHLGCIHGRWSDTIIGPPMRSHPQPRQSPAGISRLLPCDPDPRAGRDVGCPAGRPAAAVRRPGDRGARFRVLKTIMAIRPQDTAQPAARTRVSPASFAREERFEQTRRLRCETPHDRASLR